MGPSASCCETDRSRSRSRGYVTYISAPFLDAWETDRKMCGIIGVAGVPDASRVTYLGLYGLQRRGQESAGVVTVDGAGVARSHRGMGLVSDVFSETVLAGMPGDVAIGHPRYSTAGSSVIANAQPILAGYREGPLALAHNGNLTNAEALRSDLVEKGSIFQTSSDSEVLIHLIARSEAREPEDQTAASLERADCVFSVPDSSNSMALGFAEQSGLKLEHALIRNHYVGRTFINPPQAARNAKVKIKFNPVREVLEGKKVVVVDDSLVRGTTSRELVQMIRQAGAKEVHFRVASAPITGPCYYGIDTPTKSELIAANHSLAEIRQHLVVDTLGDLSLSGMLRAAGIDPAEFLHACFSGEDPT